MTHFQFDARTRIVSGPGRLNELGELARSLGAHRILLVSDPGIRAAGITARAQHSLEQAGLDVLVHDHFGENPTSADAESARVSASAFAPDMIAGVGGGSSLDLAKAASFLLSNGGQISDYWGYAKAGKPLIPVLAVPTTTGAGSEAQSYCVILDENTRRKMACGDPSAAPRIVVLDPELPLGQPFAVRAASGFDAIAHAVETWVSKKRTALSAMWSREAWRILSANYERCLVELGDIETVAAMQWGSFLAGWAIEHSMLGAAHACANPLTQRYGTTHGHALAVLLPHVVRFNNGFVGDLYRELSRELPERVSEAAAAGLLPRSLRDVGANREDLPALAARAAEEWTGKFNPRALDAAGAEEIYQCAW